MRHGGENEAAKDLVNARMKRPAELPRAPRRQGAGDGARGHLYGSGLLTPQRLKQEIAERARALGFDAVRTTAPEVVSASSPDLGARLAAWLEAGHQGTMAWMGDTAERRADPRALWPEVRSIVMLGMNYGPDEDPLEAVRRRAHAAISVLHSRASTTTTDQGKLKSWRASSPRRDPGRTAARNVKVFVDTAFRDVRSPGSRPRSRLQGKHYGARLATTSAIGSSWGRSFKPPPPTPPDPPESDHSGRAGAASTCAPRTPSPSPTCSMPAAASRT